MWLGSVDSSICREGSTGQHSSNLKWHRVGDLDDAGRVIDGDVLRISCVGGALFWYNQNSVTNCVIAVWKTVADFMDGSGDLVSRELWCHPLP